jgi:hypothetical protein
MLSLTASAISLWESRTKSRDLKVTNRLNIWRGCDVLRVLFVSDFESSCLQEGGGLFSVSF